MPPAAAWQILVMPLLADCFDAAPWHTARLVGCTAPCPAAEVRRQKLQSKHDLYQARLHEGAKRQDELYKYSRPALALAAACKPAK